MAGQTKPEVKKLFNSTIFFIKLDRLAAWVLLFVVLAYAVTGFGMTKGIIGQQLALSLHLGWLGGIGLIAFVIHTHHAIGLAFKRWRVWNLTSRMMLFLIYVMIAVFFIYLQFFYVPSYNVPIVNNNIQEQGVVTSANSKTNVKVNTVNVSSNSGANTKTNTLPVYTAKTLARYNGLNGQPAYAAVNGLVYDFSRLFRGGNHQGYSAGADLTSAFNSVHSSNILRAYPVVGTYQN